MPQRRRQRDRFSSRRARATRGADPYSYLPAQPGVGKLIKDAAPQVIPVFIAGLGNDLSRQVLGNWTGGEKIRIHFGRSA